MEQNESRALVRNIMLEFASLTGLEPAQEAPKRYLWTDAFAVCNFLELYRQTSDVLYKQLALRLIDQVHAVLGRHRDDDPRIGWISGLDEKEGKMHPTRGGLRIGKGMHERRLDEPYDEQLEWDQDGQYYHYLTKWMHALARASRVTGDPTCWRWAIELAKAAHAGFSSASRKRMYWKMSIDLSRPLVSSMGHHDPLDGLITYRELQETAPEASERSAGLDLSAEISDMVDMCKGKRWETDDVLGIGELLCSAHKLAQLMLIQGLEQADLLDVLLRASLVSLRSYDNRTLRLPAQYRLAFRELGLSIGLHAIKKMPGLLEQTSLDLSTKHQLHSLTESLMQYTQLGESIETFWLDPSNRQASEWMEHRDINMVMLATSLSPDGYLSL